MNENEIQNLKDRITKLEKIVSDISIHMGVSEKKEKKAGFSADYVKNSQIDTGEKKSPPPFVSQAPKVTQKIKPESNPVEWNSEYWLNKIGIGLLLFGIAFLLKYSIDKNLMTPAVRIFMGFAAGLLLCSIGIYIYPKRREFSQVLLGGGIAVFYITVFAAFQLYDFISYQTAFALMIVNTFLAFFISLKQNNVVLSAIGTIGGLATPFILYTSSANIPGLVAYTCVIIVGTSILYYFKGWKLLLAIYVIGGWIVHSLALNQIENINDKWALQIGLLICWATFWGVPLVREILFNKKETQENNDYTYEHIYLLSVLTPIITLFGTKEIWNLTNANIGWITGICALFYFAASVFLKKRLMKKHLAYVQSLVGLMLLTIAVCLIFEGDTRFFILTAEAATLLFISHRNNDKIVYKIGHFLFLCIGLLLIFRLMTYRGKDTAVFNAVALTDLFAIVCGLAVSHITKEFDIKRVYRLGVHVALLLFLYRELVHLNSGQGIVTITWAVYSVILLVISLLKKITILHNVALITIIVVVVKLFIIDLTALEAIWRILLFISFGVTLLFISYYFRKMLKT